jgi:hypothetical protein
MTRILLLTIVRIRKQVKVKRINNGGVYKDMFDFSVALELLKKGKKLTREGWAGKGLYVQLNKGGDYEFSEILPFFVIKNSLNSFNTWVPSISDLLAEDWIVVEIQT